MAEHFTNVVEITRFPMVCNMGNNAMSIRLYKRLEIKTFPFLMGKKTTDNGKVGLASIENCTHMLMNMITGETTSLQSWASYKVK